MATPQLILEPEFLKKLEALSLVSRRAYAGLTKGERRSVKRGASIEFADYREYSSGDDLRYVDWKAYGRLDKLFLKLFIEEEDLNLHLLIDTSKSMSFGSPLTKADYARRTAAALGYIALCEYDRVSVAPFSAGLREPMSPLRGKPGIVPFFRFLETKMPSEGETRFGDALTQYAARTTTGGIAVVISDFFDDTYQRGLKALMARNLQIVLLHVLDEDEIKPPLTGDLRLVDSETGEQGEVSISAHLLGRYEERLQKFYAELKSVSSRYGMDYVRTSTAVPFEDVILQFLRRGGLLR
ncbi:hypothetical protein CCAX7_38960 [Capsulimonas corticalis]|uniref:Uncharacterized protein n=1 Tax=Capsulimonas corticalis TaxID=2219043 RepID=A0A402D3Q3_9BACT|nr:hypothetical protein CCAX7_38960 [Capsulimonas corticalis]